MDSCVALAAEESTQAELTQLRRREVETQRWMLITTAVSAAVTAIGVLYAVARRGSGR